MTFPHGLVLASVAVSIIGSWAYIRDTLAGSTKPNRVTWFFWAFAPLAATVAALAANADPWATIRIFMAGFMPLLVLIASFVNKNAYWRLTTFDLLCGVVSAIAMALWLAWDAPIAAILLLAIGDGFASLPTIIKAWRFPKTETGLTYIGAFVSTLLVVPSIPVWNVENSAFQIYVFLSTSILIVAVYRNRVLAWTRLNRRW